MQTDTDLDVGVIYTHERQWMPGCWRRWPPPPTAWPMRLILVDNASVEGVEPCRHVVPQTQVVRNPGRLAYAANLNRIFQASTARYVLLLNSDMFFDPPAQCLARMVRVHGRPPRLRTGRLPALSRRRPICLSRRGDFRRCRSSWPAAAGWAG